MMIPEHSRHWYRNSVFYVVDVETFADGNGDGIGDFVGLKNRLPYLSELGVNALWLLPFYESPRRDGGYDITNHCSVDPRFGTFGEFLEFLHAAKEHGIRVIIELVMAHTSDEHPWFLASRYGAPESKYAGYYIWARHPETGPDDRPVFPGEEDSVWTWDDVAGRYYFHRFYSFQPTLDAANSEVLREALAIMEFWLSFGISGFRLDALPLMVMPPNREHDDPSHIITGLRALIEARDPSGVLLAEVNLPPEQIPSYIADGRHVHMIQNFLLRSFMLLALVREDARALIDGLNVLPVSHDEFQWLSALSSHDELNFERLKPEDAREICSALSPDPDTHAYARGLRRRAAPLLANRAAYEMLFSLLFSLPGAPALVWGDEIGIGDNLELVGREAVRPLMQWDSGTNGGFSEADEQALVRPPLRDGEFGYANGVNVEDQRADDTSLFTWFKRLIATRRAADEIGNGEWHVLDVNNPHVMAIRWHHEDHQTIAVHNLSDRDQRCHVNLGAYETGHFEPLFGSPETLGHGPVRLGPYGYAWWRKP